MCPPACAARAPAPNAAAPGHIVGAASPNYRPYDGDGKSLVQTAISNHHTLHERPLTRHGRANARYLRRERQYLRVKLPCAASTLCSGAVGAALVNTSVAVTSVRFYCPARSREGAGGMGRDGPEDRGCLRDAASGDACRGGPMGVRGPQPPAHFGNFSAVKSSPPEATKPCSLSAFAEQTRLRRVRADVGIGPYTPTRQPFSP